MAGAAIGVGFLRLFTHTGGVWRERTRGQEGGGGWVAYVAGSRIARFRHEGWADLCGWETLAGLGLEDYPFS